MIQKPGDQAKAYNHEASYMNNLSLSSLKELLSFGVQGRLYQGSIGYVHSFSKYGSYQVNDDWLKTHLHFR